MVQLIKRLANWGMLLGLPMLVLVWVPLIILDPSGNNPEDSPTWLWAIFVAVFLGWIGSSVVYWVIVGYTQTNASPSTMDFLKRVRDRAQPKFGNKRVVRYTGEHDLVEERVVGKVFWIFPQKEVRVLVLVPFRELDRVEVKEESIRDIVEEEKVRPKPVWVSA